MSAPYILSKLALQDQDDIWDYTVEEFGIDQAVKAIEEIDRFSFLASGTGDGSDLRSSVIRMGREP